jgi:hypothetical protein
MARKCAATRTDGTPCGNRPLKRSEFCRHRGKEAEPVTWTGTVSWPAGAVEVQ